MVLDELLVDSDVKLAVGSSHAHQTTGAVELRSVVQAGVKVCRGSWVCSGDQPCLDVCLNMRISTVSARLSVDASEDLTMTHNWVLF